MAKRVPERIKRSMDIAAASDACRCCGAFTCVQSDSPARVLRHLVEEPSICMICGYDETTGIGGSGTYGFSRADGSGHWLRAAAEDTDEKIVAFALTHADVVSVWRTRRRADGQWERVCLFGDPDEGFQLVEQKW